MVQPIIDCDHTVVGLIESAPRWYNKRDLKANVLSIIRKLISLVNVRYETLEGLALRHNIPYRLMTPGSDEAIIRWIEGRAPDLIVVFSMSQLLGENIFRLPRLGTINLHLSFLPFYRGPNPDFWHYYNTDLNPGVTVHYVDRGEDTGDIIAQKRVKIPLGIRSSDYLNILINQVGVPLLMESIKNIVENNSKRYKQPRTSPTPRARNLNRSEHRSLIDWENWSTERVWHLLRGTDTWLNALEQPKYLMYGQRWEVGDYKILGKSIGVAGTIVKTNGCYVLCTKDGIIELAVKFKIKNIVLKLLGK